jgi:hypothetical protein
MYLTTHYFIISFQILLIFLVVIDKHIVTSTNQKQAFLKGALLFEQQNEQAIIINPQQITFYRYLNFSTIWDASRLAKHFTETYGKFCNEVEDSYKRRITNFDNTFIFDKTLVKLADAQNFCEKSNSFLPEIRTLSEVTKLLELLTNKNILLVKAGIHYDKHTKTLRFNSDKRLISEGYFKDILDVTLIAYPLDNKEIFHKISHGNAFIIYIQHAGRLRMALKHGEHLYSSSNPSICQRMGHINQEEIRNNILLQFTLHNCKKDEPMLIGTTKRIEKEISDFQSIISHKRIRRDTICRFESCSKLKLVYNIMSKTSFDLDSKFAIATEKLKMQIFYKYFKDTNQTTTSFENFTNTIISTNNLPTDITPSKENTALFDIFKEQAFPGKFTYHFSTNFSFNSNISNIFKAIEGNIRRKRSVGLLGGIAGTIALGGTTSSIMNNEAPFSWIGNILSSTLGIATKSDLKQIVSQLKSSSIKLETLQLNQRILEMLTIRFVIWQTA